MKCPKCNQPLVMSEGQGVEIDYRPECRGVGLTAANSTRSWNGVAEMSGAGTTAPRRRVLAAGGRGTRSKPAEAAGRVLQRIV